MNSNEPLISKWLNENYSLGKILEIELIRSYTNNVYKIVTATNKYVLKIYGKGWRTSDDIHWEVELLEFLNSKGLVISKAVSAIDGESVKLFEGQFAVLYNFAIGDKPEKPFAADLYFLFGKAIGEMHKLSDDFKSEYTRKDIDITYLIDNPVKLALSFLSNNNPDAKVLRDTANKVKLKIRHYQKDLDWGLIHGDATLDNLHITNDNKVVLYDFDSGGIGWRASDLQGWALGKDEYKEKYKSFIDGYRSVKSLNERDVEASVYLTVAWEIWGLEVDLNNRIIKQGQEAIDKYLKKQIDLIAKLALVV